MNFSSCFPPNETPPAFAFALGLLERVGDGMGGLLGSLEVALKKAGLGIPMQQVPGEGEKSGT